MKCKAQQAESIIVNKQVMCWSTGWFSGKVNSRKEKKTHSLGNSPIYRFTMYTVFTFFGGAGLYGRLNSGPCVC
jgi:hypothetical protein